MAYKSLPHLSNKEATLKTLEITKNIVNDKFLVETEFYRNKCQW